MPGRVIVIDLSYKQDISFANWVSLPLNKQNIELISPSIEELEFGITINDLINHIEKIKDEKIVIGFEAPMFWLYEKKGRFSVETAFSSRMVSKYWRTSYCSGIFSCTSII